MTQFEDINSENAAVSEWTDVEFRWDKRSPGIKVPSLVIRKGETVLVQGASGSGKSTLLSILAGINLPQAGRVCMFGEDVSSLSMAKRDKMRADRMGVIFQQFNLLPYLSATENVLLTCQFSEIRSRLSGASAVQRTMAAKDLLSTLGLRDISELRRKVTKLSVGQQQRIAAARALIGQPDLIIADEPTSALDPENRDKFVSVLLEEAAKNKTTLVFASHDPELESHFSRVIKLNGSGATGEAQI